MDARIVLSHQTSVFPKMEAARTHLVARLVRTISEFSYRLVITKSDSVIGVFVRQKEHQ